MRIGVGITTGLIGRLAATIAVTTAPIAMHESRAAPAFTGETGRPSNLINRPACWADGAPADWFDCKPVAWPQARNRSLHRPWP